MERADVPDQAERDLTVVMPAYNEAEGIEDCLRSWIDVLSKLPISYRIDVYDDGSSDDTASVLAAMADLPEVSVVSKPNEGHGPTILGGYRAAVAESTWVFQVDTDDELPATSFPEAWEARAGVDAVFGYRTGRDQELDRMIISKVAGLTSRLAFRSRVRDVNVPFRLLRSEALAPVLDDIPNDTFAPNVVISGALGRNPQQFSEVAVPFTPRRTGTVSIAGWSAIRSAVVSFVQTLRLTRRLR